MLASPDVRKPVAELACGFLTVKILSEDSVTHARNRFLHVANGTSTTMTIEAAGIPGISSIWADPLYEGPVPGDISDDALVEVRAQYLGGNDADGEPDPVNDLREWRAVIARHDEYDELVLWYEHDLFDQLNLAQLLTWIRGRLPASKAVTLICIGEFPGRPDFKGLGELEVRELAPLLDSRQPVTTAQYEAAERVWRAFRSPTPEALDTLRRSDTSAMPFMSAALTRFLQEYPWTRDGLSRTERRLLELAQGDGISLLKAFPQMHQGERMYYVTDLTLAGIADALAGTTPPLVTIDRANRPARRPLDVHVTLTDTGRSTLAGHTDRLSGGGVDRWLGGVHLLPGRPVWRWDDERQAMTVT